MEEIIISTQQEFDHLPDNFKQNTIIIIKDVWITVNRAWELARVVAWENSHVVARENSHVEARENSHVEARENSHVEAWGNSHVEAWENSHVVAWGNSHVVAWENSHVEARGTAHVVARENSHVEARENSHVEARENSHVVAWGNSHVVARGNSHVVAWGNSHVVARENSHVEAWGNVSVKIYSKIELTLKQEAVAICINTKVTIIECDDTASILYKNEVLYDIKSFIDIHHLAVKNNTVILYKTVNPHTLCDFYTGKIKYENTVECPDFDPNHERECGGGLHLSPTPEMALLYNRGKLLKCSVELPDIVVHPFCIDKVRCKKVTVLAEVTP